MQTQVAGPCVVEYDDVGQGLPVVLLHAFPFSREMWQPQRAALQRDCRVITPDLRGFGGTDGFSGSPSVDQMADDVAGLLDALAIRERVVVGGLSMGGYVALAFARRYPGRLRGLILADTRAEADTPEGKAAREQAIAFARAHPVGDLFAQMEPKLLGEQTRKQRPAVVEEARRIAAAQTQAGVIAALQALRDRPDATPGLVRIAVPTLVLIGTEDTLTPPAVAQTLVGKIPGAQFAALEGAGHLSNLEQPELFNAAVAGFLHGRVLAAPLGTAEVTQNRLPPAGRKSGGRYRSRSRKCLQNCVKWKLTS